MKVKLIIWDLDDTLWTGTLAEKDTLHLSEFRAAVIRESNKRGVVNAICSKNEFEMAKERLIDYGLWDEFVFPRIEFSPKGALVRWILESMQLRAENTIFIDDNVMNLKEVEHFSPGITVLDALAEDTDSVLQKILEDNSHVNKNRIEQYRVLERKMDDRVSSQVNSNEEFLKTCGIKISLIRRAENLPYSDRIEELINRTNQLNFTKNRVEKESITDYILDVDTNDTYSIFVWDNYGIYGLAGFYSVERNSVCPHFLFSCRTMNMGIEQFLYQKMKLDRYLQLPELSTTNVDWIEVVPNQDPKFLEVLEKMGKKRTVNTHVMANCQSGIISHYLNEIYPAHIDNWPNVFSLSGNAKGAVQQLPHNSAKNLIYGAFNDYNDAYWETPPSLTTLRNKIVDSLRQWTSKNLLVVIILPPENICSNKYRPDLGVTEERVQTWNEIFKQESERHQIECWTIDEFVHSDTEVIDIRHYDRIIFERIGDRLNSVLNG
jgi:FkbH-like protein